jgi:hypothetical protein
MKPRRVHVTDHLDIGKDPALRPFRPKKTRRTRSDKGKPRGPRGDYKNKLLELNVRKRLQSLPKTHRSRESLPPGETRDPVTDEVPKHLVGRVRRVYVNRVKKERARFERAARAADALDEAAEESRRVDTLKAPMRERRASRRAARLPRSLRCPGCGRGPLLRTGQWVVRRDYGVCLSCWRAAKTELDKRALRCAALAVLMADRAGLGASPEHVTHLMMPNNKPRSPHDGRKPGPGRKRVHPSKSINEARRKAHRSRVKRGLEPEEVGVVQGRMSKLLRSLAPEAADFEPVDLRLVDRMFPRRL